MTRRPPSCCARTSPHPGGTRRAPQKSIFPCCFGSCVASTGSEKCGQRSAMICSAAAAATAAAVNRCGRKCGGESTSLCSGAPEYVVIMYRCNIVRKRVMLLVGLPSSLRHGPSEPGVDCRGEGGPFMQCCIVCNTLVLKFIHDISNCAKAWW